MKKLFDKFFEEITLFGGIAFFLFVIILFAIIGEIDYAIKLLIGLIAIYFITLVIRLFYFKPRPHREKYNNILEKIDASSFPSIHAARTIFLVLFAVKTFSLNIYVQSLLFLILLLVILSRVYLKKHYWKDLAGGLLLGLIVSYF